MKTRVIAWWSGGIASALACLWAIQHYSGLGYTVVVVFIDTRNEDEDTYRFLTDCEKLYGRKIEVITNTKYNSIWDVWRKYKSLNTAHGAICSSELKRAMREAYQNLDTDYGQVFGFDAAEKNRHNNMRRNYPEINVISPHVHNGHTKEDLVDILKTLGIEPPDAYKRGFRNNNCLKSGCVQGGIGYWQELDKQAPEIVDTMGFFEHELTELKGSPVTILKDQSKGGGLVFLRHNPKYPHMKDLSMMKGRKPEPLMECHGFCSTKD